MNQTTKRILLLLLMLVLVVGGVFVGMNWNDWFGGQQQEEASTGIPLDDNAEDYDGDREVYQGEKNTDTIDIPGFDVMNLKAGAAKQSVNLYNPEQNTCYFQISLLLSDGTELWSSGLIEPGKGVYEITLDRTLAAGEYKDAMLKYECFALDNQTPLNGAEIKLTLNVME